MKTPIQLKRHGDSYFHLHPLHAVFSICSVSTRKDWGMMVPAFIMMVPGFMVPDNRVSPSVEDRAVNEKSVSKRKGLALRRGFRSFRANLIRR